MFSLASDKEIGAYLSSLIELKPYPSVRQFSKAYLEMRNDSTNDDEIRKLNNRILQILKGTKRIQIDDLPYISKLLDVSFEEILSAGRSHNPVISHMTNYDIAFSQDRETWEKYMKREDNLFLNCDEYGKSVIDYALEFKNYAFIKYLLEERFIWFVDLTAWHDKGFSFGAGTSVKRREPGYVDSFTPIEIQSQDRLRTRTIALAVENNDFEILDSLRAREIPEMELTAFPVHNSDYQNKKDEDLLRAVALSENRDIIDYFSSEFTVTNRQKNSNRFVFPFLGELIEMMIENGNSRSAEVLVRKAIRHNRSVLEKLKALIDTAYEHYRSHLGFNPKGMEEYIKQQTLSGFSYDAVNHLVSFYYCPEKRKYSSLVSNIVRVTSGSSDPLLEELIIQLNESYDEIVALKGGAE